MVDNSIPWPKKGDKLFKSDGDWRHNACFNSAPDQWDLYATGYKKAGDLLVEHTRKPSRSEGFLDSPVLSSLCRCHNA